jgi:tetratricopeptide (TPR) repeat protein
MGLLSLAMIVRNEADRLGACLASVRGLVDEMVVLDTGSTDATLEVATGFGAHTDRIAWTDDFAAARNESLRRCTGDWILVLDADERLDPRGTGAIREALQRGHAKGFLLTVRNYLPSGAYLGIHGGAKPNPGGFPGTERLAYMTEFPALRLVRRHERLRYSGRIHELLDPSFEALGWRAEPLGAVIHHFGKAEPTREQAKQDTYFRIASAEAAERPSDARAQYNLLQEAAMVEAWEACAEAALAFVRLESKVPLKVRLDGARALRELGRLEEAAALLDAAAGGPGAQPALAVARAELWLARGQADQAVSAFVEAIERDPHFTLPFLRLAEWLRRSGDPQQARALLQAGLDQNPKDLLLWEALVGLGAAEGDLAAAAHDAWDALAVIPHGGGGLWHQLAAQALLRGGNTAEASEVVTRGLIAFPGDPELARLSAQLPPIPETRG